MGTGERDAERGDGATPVTLRGSQGTTSCGDSRSKGATGSASFGRGRGLLRRVGFCRSTVETIVSSSPIPVKSDCTETGAVAAWSP